LLQSFRKSSGLALWLGVWVILMAPALGLRFGAVYGQEGFYTSFSDYELYNSPAAQNRYQPRIQRESIFRLTAKNAINSDGLGGLFVSNTADLLKQGELILSSRFKHNELNSAYGRSYKSAEKGTVSSFETSLTWVGEWAEWAVTVPIHKWDLSAPRTYGGYAESDTGIGSMRLGWKGTYLNDHSYYRAAYGVVATVGTGNPENMLPSGASKGDEYKLFGCVTTKETDRATANIELGYIFNNDYHKESRFVYNFGLSYEATDAVSLVGEFAGEVIGGDNKDNLDMILGARFAATELLKIELAWYRNLRTYRAYGWDDRLQAGFAFWW
jgi:hypothetical protein